MFQALDSTEIDVGLPWAGIGDERRLEQLWLKDQQERHQQLLRQLKAELLEWRQQPQATAAPAPHPPPETTPRSSTRTRSSTRRRR